MATTELTVEQRLNLVVNHAFGGWHHVGRRKETGRGGVQFSVYGSLATVDFNQLTKLVLACHAVRVRAEITHSGPGLVKIFLNPREDKPASWSEHHPSIDDLIAAATKLKAQIET